MDAHDRDKNIDEKDEDNEYSPDPMVNEALKEAAEGKNVSVRYGDRETGFKTKKKNVRTRDKHIHWIHSRE